MLKRLKDCDKNLLTIEQELLNCNSETYRIQHTLQIKQNTTGYRYLEILRGSVTHALAYLSCKTDKTELPNDEIGIITSIIETIYLNFMDIDTALRPLIDDKDIKQRIFFYTALVDFSDSIKQCKEVLKNIKEQEPQTSEVEHAS